MPTKPMTLAELAAIKARWDWVRKMEGSNAATSAVGDIDALLDEVERLRGAIVALPSTDSQDVPVEVRQSLWWQSLRVKLDVLRGIAGEAKE